MHDYTPDEGAISPQVDPATNADQSPQQLARWPAAATRALQQPPVAAMAMQLAAVPAHALSAADQTQ